VTEALLLDLERVGESALGLVGGGGGGKGRVESGWVMVYEGKGNFASADVGCIGWRLLSAALHTRG
jgi:hypothetical protein